MRGSTVHLAETALIGSEIYFNDSNVITILEFSLLIQFSGLVSLYYFSDGPVYILCPIIPFGSIYKWELILEIYSDAHRFGLKSANSTAVNNSNSAITWWEATFPELSQEARGGENLSAVKAHPYALFDASLALQFALQKS
ncbi:hypothetical protein SLA2020_248680 [Shorea laevis]